MRCFFARRPSRGAGGWTVGRQYGGLTHVTVVVPDLQPEGWRFYVFDPTFNLVFRREEGYARLAQILGDPIEELRVESMPLEGRDFIVSPANRAFCTEIKERKDDFLVCSHLGYGIDYYLKAERQTFIDQSLPTGLEGFIQLIRERVFWLGPTLDAEPKERLRRMLESMNVPIGPAP